MRIYTQVVKHYDKSGNIFRLFDRRYKYSEEDTCFAKNIQSNALILLLYMLQ